MKITHPIPPLYDSRSRVLILGSFPSVKSREARFFYGHPQNRFWKVTAAVFGCAVPETVAQKKEFLLSHHLAVWDVIASCEIQGSSDSSIRDVTPNHLNRILGACDIEKIFVNGKTAEKLYNRYCLPVTERAAVYLPSTSPANAAWTVERLLPAWKKIKISDCQS